MVSPKDNGQTPMENKMKFTTLMRMLEALEKEDQSISLHIEIASAVKDNLDLSAYDEEGVEEICKRIEKQYLCSSTNCDIDTFVYAIQDQLDNGNHETIDDDCLEDAWAQGRDMDAFNC